MRSAAGHFGSPGIVSTSPVSATMKPAPAETLTSRTVTVKSSGAPSLVYLRGGFGQNFNVPTAVDALHDGAQLVLNAAVKTVCKAEITGLLAEPYYGLSKLRAARAALRPYIAQRDIHVEPAAAFAHQIKLLSLIHI